MGIININDDSFSGDGSLDLSVVTARAKQMIADGADIIDIGAESARTNRPAIPEDEEWARLQPFLDAWPEMVAHPVDGRLWPPLLSVNTWRTKVVRQSCSHRAADLINDMSALPDPLNAQACADSGVALLIMHSVGLPKEPHTHVGWENILSSLGEFFEEKIALCESVGLDRERLVLDPGLDFAKQKADNLAILREMESLHRHQRPILLPVSRKTVIGEVLNLPSPTDRDPGTIACIAAGMRRGAAIFRVHRVPEAVAAVKTLSTLLV